MARFIYLHCALRHTNIWRRIRIRQTYRLSDLHDAMQSAFGWHDSHLHQFVGSDGTKALCPHGQDIGLEFGDPPAGRAAKMKISSMLAKQGEMCEYEYDFGDGWVVDIEVERVTNEKEDHPSLLDGALAGPPEDCGGVPGYERCAEFVVTGVDPFEDDAASLREWLNGWTPDSFVSPASTDPKQPKKAQKKKSTKATRTKAIQQADHDLRTVDMAKIEEGAFAVLALTLHDGNRVWKSFDWDLMESFHERGWISKPATKAKSVSLSPEGMERARSLALKYFGS